MPKNFLVGIGGSGARITEAALFLCASGLGPEKLFLFLIDPDKGNGNLERTLNLMSSYLECSKLFEPYNDVQLFHTALIVPENEKDRIWSIFDKTNMTLSEWIGYDGLNEDMQRDEKDMMSILFSNQELTTKLDQGFRGHPSIGAVVMTELPENKFPFKLLWDQLPEGKAFDVRLFLVGSVFGGTGAAGFPTLGHNNALKFNPNKGAIINKEESISRILLGGALILPYFKVAKNDNQADMHVTSGDFPIATKAALEFYDAKESLGFDQVYFIGDSLSQDVGDFSVGSSSQKNTPHYVEVVSTLAAFDFYAQPLIEKKEKDPIYFIAKRDSETIDWKSFPFSRDENKISNEQNKFKSKITVMTVFCYVLVTYVKSIIDPANDTKNKNEFIQAWWTDHFKLKKEDDIFNPRTVKNKEFLDKVIDFAESYLEWIMAISDYDNVALIDKTKIIDSDNKWKNPVNLSLIGELLKETSKENGWTDREGKGFLQSLNAIDLQHGTKSFSAANRLLNLFYLAAEKFAENNYYIERDDNP